MTKDSDRQKHTVDASGRSLGRLAAEISVLLRGKHKATFAPHKDEGDFVVVQHLENMNITGRKLEQKVYYRHSGYPGGLKEKRVKQLLEERPSEVLRKAVWGMLPKNRLRKEQIKRLNVES